MIHGRKPNLAHLKIIGSQAYVLIKNTRDRPATAKLQEKAVKGWLVGFDATNVYKVWIPHLDRVVRSRDVQVDEKVMYDPQLDTSRSETRQALSAIINEVDLDEEDIALQPITDDTAVAEDSSIVQCEVPRSMPPPPSTCGRARHAIVQTEHMHIQLQHHSDLVNRVSQFKVSPKHHKVSARQTR